MHNMYIYIYVWCGYVYIYIYVNMDRVIGLRHQGYPNNGHGKRQVQEPKVGTQMVISILRFRV